MMKSKIQILTVVYHENFVHFNQAKKAWSSFPKGCEITAVINRRLNIPYPSNIDYLTNKENCLASAWNMGLKYIFEDFDIAVVSGLDSISPQKDQLEYMINTLIQHPEYGIVSATPLNYPYEAGDMKHGDGSFSFFVITKDTFGQVGDFDERFKPAYFEDNDYLERLWLKGYKPQRLDVKYFHITQGTVKFGTESKKNYPLYVQKNLDLFKSIHGKVPEHLPQDIQFS